MANHEDVDVARLRRGVAAWNEWRAQQYEQEQQWYERKPAKSQERSGLRPLDLGPGALVMPRKYHLRGADLRETDLRGADLREMDLREADLRGADCRNADLRQAMLIDSLLDRANLTGAKLWETQRDGWSIKDVICEGVFWDRECNERTEYGIGDFERIFAEKPRIELRYPGGISPVDLTMLPLIIDRLQAEHPDCALHIRSLNDAGSGALVTITVDDLAGRDAEAFRGEVDGQNNYLWQPAYRLGEPEILLGRPCIEAVDMPDVASGTFPIAFGDWSTAYRIYDKANGFSVMRDPTRSRRRGASPAAGSDRRCSGKVLGAMVAGMGARRTKGE